MCSNCCCAGISLRNLVESDPELGPVAYYDGQAEKLLGSAARYLEDAGSLDRVGRGAAAAVGLSVVVVAASA
jgi:hypothetical protein